MQKRTGAGSLEFDQFKELMKDAKKRKLNLQKQLDTLQAQVSQEVIDADSQEFYNEVQRILKEYNFTDETNKIQIIRNVVDKVTIKERGGVEVCAYILLTIQKLGYEPISRDTTNTTRHYSFPFVVKIKLPKPLKDRIIVHRDEVGKIVHSQVTV